MTPEEINLAIMGVEFLIKEVPEIQAEIQALTAKDNPTPEDWSALRARVVANTYAKLVPNSVLPPS